MRRLKVLAVLVILAIAGLAAYAYLGDMAPERREIRVPILLDGDGAVAGRPTDAAATEAAPAEPGASDTADAAVPADADALD